MLHGGIITIFVSDFAQALDFYRNSLGFSLEYLVEHKWACLDAGGGLKLGLHPRSAQQFVSAPHGAISIGFTVSIPLDEAVVQLSARGVRFHGSIADGAEGNIRMAFFADPDGNEHYLCEYLRNQ